MLTLFTIHTNSNYDHLTVLPKRALLREEDTLARVSGDEFVLLLPGASNQEQADLIANKLLNQIQDPFVF